MVMGMMVATLIKEATTMITNVNIRIISISISIATTDKILLLTEMITTMTITHSIKREIITKIYIHHEHRSSYCHASTRIIIINNIKIIIISNNNNNNSSSKSRLTDSYH